MCIAASLLAASHGLGPVESVPGGEDDPDFFDGFDGRWTVTAGVNVRVDSTEERTLQATVHGGTMDPARFYRITLTGPLPDSFAKDCPETFGVPLPCETRFYLSCYCSREEVWFQESLLRSSRSWRRHRSLEPSRGRPDSTATKLVLKREVHGRITAYDVWTRGEGEFVLRHLRVVDRGRLREVAELTFRERKP